MEAPQPRPAGNIEPTQPAGRLPNTAVPAERQAQALQRIQDLEQELRDKNQELEDFTRLVSHDLQGSLLQVSAFSDVLRKELGDHLPEPAVRSLRYITDGVQQMHALVQALLAFSRLGQIALQRRPIGLESCVRAALRALASQIEGRQAVIVAGALPTVNGDPAMLAQLYQHLLSNALKYVRAGRVVVRLTAERRDTTWVLGVHDNGIGIDRRYAEYIFSPFNRLHTNSEYAGTGIGLAICRRIVTRHGGRIWLESEIGQGAAFYFTLPGDLP